MSGIPPARHKTLIFVVAYNAAQHISSVLARVAEAAQSLEHVNLQTLLIDDASSDNTAALAEQFRVENALPLTVLRNPVNQGYGGNQKIGYQYALRFGFDSVVLLHGDGQYPPECIEAMLDALLAQQADVVLGSRMIDRASALKGGMPLYKFAGNILLTFLQNKLLDMHLNEFHTGFRAYRTAWLARIPFAYNSNDFDFDTDILIQARLSGARIVEIPIPTHYGDEVCHVNSVKYAAQILRNSLLARVQRFQIYYHPKFDLAPDTGYASKTGFDSSHSFALRHVEPYSTVLDIGGSSGHVAQALRRQKGCRAYGIDICQSATAEENYDAFVSADLDREDIAAFFPRDISIQVILLLDVLEHLDSPERFLAALRTQTAAMNPKIIFTTANVGFLFTRLSLLIGNFNYGKRGIMDFTHKRLFTFGSFRRLLLQYGYAIERMEGIPAPFALAVSNRRAAQCLSFFNRAALRLSKTLFAYQIGAVARPLPTLDVLLERGAAAQPWSITATAPAGNVRPTPPVHGA